MSQETREASFDLGPNDKVGLTSEQIKKKYGEGIAKNAQKRYDSTNTSIYSESADQVFLDVQVAIGEKVNKITNSKDRCQAIIDHLKNNKEIDEFNPEVGHLKKAETALLSANETKYQEWKARIGSGKAKPEEMGDFKPIYDAFANYDKHMQGSSGGKVDNLLSNIAPGYREAADKDFVAKKKDLHKKKVVLSAQKKLKDLEEDISNLEASVNRIGLGVHLLETTDRKPGDNGIDNVWYVADKLIIDGIDGLADTSFGSDKSSRDRILGVEKIKLGLAKRLKNVGITHV